MTVAASTEARSMPKQQRSIQLPAEAFRLAEAFESRGGAKFNRQVLAALLQYYCSRAWGPDQLWMDAAVQLERDTSFADVLRLIAQRLDDELDDKHNEAVGAGREQREFLGDRTLQDVRGTSMMFKQAAASEDPIQGLIEIWNKFSPRTSKPADK